MTACKFNSSYPAISQLLACLLKIRLLFNPHPPGLQAQFGGFRHFSDLLMFGIRAAAKKSAAMANLRLTAAFWDAGNAFRRRKTRRIFAQSISLSTKFVGIGSSNGNRSPAAACAENLVPPRPTETFR
ncbi:MAG: hypothetical protein HZA89_15410 [Verrucomicrobia bacterium]|nr:hypothetical protein [Verrucomicrobiota bacterium]